MVTAKKTIFILVILGITFPVFGVLAKFPDDLPIFSAMPDSPFYFLKIWYEKAVLFFTFDLTARAERYRVFAEKRAYEAQEMVKLGKIDLAQRAEESFRFYLNKAKESLERAIQKAIERKKEELKRELEKKVEDIIKKLKESSSL